MQISEPSFNIMWKAPRAGAKGDSPFKQEQTTMSVMLH